MNSRAKGNRLEREVGREFLVVDGPDELYEQIASSTGRVGHLDVGCDVVTRTFAIETKCRESLSDLFWQWLDHISVPRKVKLLVVKKNRRDPLVVLRQSDFLDLCAKRRP